MNTAVRCHPREGKTPISAMQNCMPRYGIMLLCGWLPVVVLIAAGAIATFGAVAA